MKIDRGKDIPDGLDRPDLPQVGHRRALHRLRAARRLRRPDAGTHRAGRQHPAGRAPRCPLEFSELLRSASALVVEHRPRRGRQPRPRAGPRPRRAGRGPARPHDRRSTRITSHLRRPAPTQLDRLAENNTRITRVLADHRLSIGRSITNLRAVARGAAQRQGRPPGRCSTTARRSSPPPPTSWRTRSRTSTASSPTSPRSCALAATRPLDDLAHAAPRRAHRASGTSFSAVDREPDGPWIRVNLALPVGGTDPKIYTPRATLPVVPTISPCASTLRPRRRRPSPPVGHRRRGAGGRCRRRRRAGRRWPHRRRPTGSSCDRRTCRRRWRAVGGAGAASCLAARRPGAATRCGAGSTAGDRRGHRGAEPPRTAPPSADRPRREPPALVLAISLAVALRLLAAVFAVLAVGRATTARAAG